MDTSSLMFPKPKDKKSKPKQTRTKACDIPQRVKEVVWNRDNKQCIFCHKLVPKSCANAYLIKRSQGGLGIEQNIFTACPKCHFEEDLGKNTKKYEEAAEKYLRAIYGANWDKKCLIYKKGEKTEWNLEK